MGKSKSHKILGTKSEFFFWLNAMKMFNFNLLELVTLRGLLRIFMDDYPQISSAGHKIPTFLFHP